MARMDKPIRIGRAGFTPLFVTICLTEKAWQKATKHRNDAPMYPRHDAACTNFPRHKSYAPVSIITVSPAMLKARDVTELMGLLCHEMVHAKQFCEELMATRFDDETEAHFVQHLVCGAWRKIEPFVGRPGK